MTELTRRQMAGLNNVKYASQQFVLGIDEVGLGAWAGPVYVTGVVLPREWHNSFIKDSKRMSPAARKAAIPIIEKDARLIHTVSASSQDIDTKGIKYVLDRLVVSIVTFCLMEVPSTYVVLDGDTSPLDPNDTRHIVFPKADDLVPAVSAASIVAKVARDTKMDELSREFPHYHFDKHKGYGTKQHTEQLEAFGICPIHRRSYAPIKRIAQKS